MPQRRNKSLHVRFHPARLGLCKPVDLHPQLFTAVPEIVAICMKIVAALQEDLDENQVIQDRGCLEFGRLPASRKPTSAPLTDLIDRIF